MLRWLRERTAALLSREDLGRRGERLACRFLRRRGMRIVARNVRARRGEIDVIAIDGASLVFVEVKSRAYSPKMEVTGLEKLDRRKRRALRQSCRHYVRRLSWSPESVRLDVVTVEFDTATRGGKVRDIRWYPGFVELYRHG